MAHDRSHAITSTTNHTAGNWKLFYSDGSGEVQELALGAANKPFLSGGAAAAPAFGTWLMASAVVDAAGATPEDSDVSAWATNTYGIVKGTGGDIWLTFKNAVDVYYVQMNAI